MLSLLSMSSIEALTHINIWTVLLGVFVIMFAIKAIVDIVGYFKGKLGITTGFEQDRAEEERRIRTLESHDRWQYNEIQKIEELLKDIQENCIDERISTLRWRILDFTSGLAGGRRYNKETFEQVFDMDRQYEDILKKYNKTNDVVNESMKFIKDTYQQKLRNGDFDL